MTSVKENSHRDGAGGTPALPVKEPTRVFDLLAYQLTHHPQPDALARKADGAWRAYPAQEVADTVRALAAGLHAAGVRAGDRVANTAETNRPEWNFVDLAVMSLGAVHVPVYPTLTAEEFAFILEDAGAKLVFVSSAALCNKVASVWDRLPGVEAIYTYDPVEGESCWEELRRQGEALLKGEPGTAATLQAAADAVRPEQMATLIYTSGTTGQPKGVMLSHANLVSNALAIAPLIAGIGHGPGARVLSFLPLCHIFERTVCNACVHLGMPVYYAESLDTVGANLREVRPRFFAAVPRILEKVFERVMARGHALTGWPRKIFFWSLGLAERLDPEGRVGALDRLRLWLANRLVFSKWRAALGGQVAGIVSGSAALNPRLARIFWNAGVRVYEGYGPTEAAPVISTNHPGAGGHRIGTVGPVIAGGEVRLATDGEILYRGPNVMLGYYHQPELTAETVDAEGFLHTGDVGEFVAGAGGTPFLRITDRKKEIFKTSGGKYIAPQPLENKLKESPYIAQAMAVGEYRKFPGALIVPNFGAMRVKLGVAAGDGELVKLLAARELVAGEVARLMEGTAQYARVKDFALLGREWTADGGELTPTQKLKRREIVKKYAAEIEEIYGGQMTNDK